MLKSERTTFSEEVIASRDKSHGGYPVPWNSLYHCFVIVLLGSFDPFRLT
jgi:hypothetical protein